MTEQPLIGLLFYDESAFVSYQPRIKAF